MCGIAGILRRDDYPVDRAALLRMQGVLTSRGPDDQGILIDGRLGFAHTRLAILDSTFGQQPMMLPDQKLSIVFNGEIYNHRELRTELAAKGYRFTTDHSDTEVLLHGFREWFGDLPSHLRGMYAFAIWDGQNLFLARDRVGKKPLFVYEDDRVLLFASTPAAICAALPEKPKIDRDALYGYLAYGYTLSQTPLKGIVEFPPSTMIQANPRRVLAAPHHVSENTTTVDVDTFTQLIIDAVRIRLDADVPLGCFLSGGIDSSLIAAIAQKELSKRGERLKTFCVSMPDISYDEAVHARRVAEHIGSEHYELHAEPHVEADLLNLTQLMGEPFADSSILPTYWLSCATRKHVKVTLSGDGGDEVFAGYERYIAARTLRAHAWWLSKCPVIPFRTGEKSLLAKYHRMVTAARMPVGMRQYLSLVRLFNDEQLRLLGVAEPNSIADHDAISAYSDPAASARQWDLLNYLPGDLLRKVDRASMAVGLEVRSPLLDDKVLNASLASDFKSLLSGWQTKPLLREVAKPFLPETIIRRKKMGFAIPLGKWFNGSLQTMLRRWLLDEPYLGAIGLHREMIENLMYEHSRGREHTHRLFSLLSLAMWLAWVETPTR